MAKGFESFLMDKFADDIRGTERDVFDDDFPDAFNDWLCELDVEDLIKYADQYKKEK